MKKLLLIGTVLTLLVSCSPEARISRIVKKNPDLIKPVKVEVKDTIYTTDIKTDTQFVMSQSGKIDTFYVKKDSLSIRVIHDGYKIKVLTEVKPYAVYKTKYVNVPQIVISKKHNIIVWILIIFNILVFGYSILKRKR